MRRESRGRGADVDCAEGGGAFCEAVTAGWLDEVAVVCVFGTVCEVPADEAGTPLVCGWLDDILLMV